MYFCRLILEKLYSNENIKYYEKTFSIIYIIMKNKIYLNKFIDENKRSYES